MLGQPIVMAKFTSTAGSKRAKAAPTPQRSVPDIQLVPEQELHLFPKFGQWVVNAVGGKSPQTAPARFGGLIGQMGEASARQAGVLQQLQQSYGNYYVGQVIQAKLTVGQPGDVYEEEADRVADMVMRMPEPDISPSASVSHHIQPLRIQRMCTECREEERIHPKEALGQTPTVTPALEARLNTTSSGSGQPLPKSVRAFMEPRFGTDFSGVRIHAGSEAGALNRALKSQAFTRQRDIYFRTGKYNPESSEGRWLLAHELTHVVQQGGTSKSLSSNTPHIQRLVEGDITQMVGMTSGWARALTDDELGEQVRINRRYKTYEECVKGCRDRAGDIRKMCRIDYGEHKDKKKLRECLKSVRKSERKCIMKCAPLYPVA